MKSLLLILLIALSGISFATDTSLDDYSHINVQEQAFQSFINKAPGSNHLMQQIQQRGALIITPTGFCDERTVCTSNLQCGFDGGCERQYDGLSRCVCY
ncbi:hypothetical protein [Marinicella sp. W31]|uniref:hypothetical protein n=1 Tax=Marinicella sp. W31 TaxID=3023713 RepID=UPI0037574EEC